MIEPDEFAETLAEENTLTVTSLDDEEPPSRTRKRRSDAGQKRTGTVARGRKPNSAKLAANLMQPWVLVASALAPRAPTGAAVMIQRGEVTCDALVQIAMRYPKALKALEALGTIGPATVVIQTGVEITIACAMDWGKLPPDHPMASGLGLTQTYLEMHPTYGQWVPNQEETPQQTPAPVGFIPATDPRHPMYSFNANPFGVKVSA